MVPSPSFLFDTKFPYHFFLKKKTKKKRITIVFNVLLDRARTSCYIPKAVMVIIFNDYAHRITVKNKTDNLNSPFVSKALSVG